LTTVYIDIDIPIVNITYNRTFPNGTVTTYTDQRPEFGCSGKNTGDFSVNAGGDIASIEGSFIAPENVGTGPDFYDTEVNDCIQEKDDSNFAFEFFCYSKYENQDT
jgi:hypothetical protein